MKFQLFHQFTLNESGHPMKFRRGSSPNQEMHDGFADWADGLRPAVRPPNGMSEDPEEATSLWEYIPEEQPQGEEHVQDDES